MCIGFPFCSLDRICIFFFIFIFLLVVDFLLRSMFAMFLRFFLFGGSICYFSIIELVLLLVLVPVFFGWLVVFYLRWWILQVGLLLFRFFLWFLLLFHWLCSFWIWGLLLGGRIVLVPFGLFVFVLLGLLFFLLLLFGLYVFLCLGFWCHFITCWLFHLL